MATACGRAGWGGGDAPNGGQECYIKSRSSLALRRRARSHTQVLLVLLGAQWVTTRVWRWRLKTHALRVQRRLEQHTVRTNAAAAAEAALNEGDDDETLDDVEAADLAAPVGRPPLPSSDSTHMATPMEWDGTGIHTAAHHHAVRAAAPPRSTAPASSPAPALVPGAASAPAAIAPTTVAAPPPTGTAEPRGHGNSRYGSGGSSGSAPTAASTSRPQQHQAAPHHTSTAGQSHSGPPHESFKARLHKTAAAKQKMNGGAGRSPSPRNEGAPPAAEAAADEDDVHLPPGAGAPAAAEADDDTQPPPLRHRASALRGHGNVTAHDVHLPVHKKTAPGVGGVVDVAASGVWTAAAAIASGDAVPPASADGGGARAASITAADLKGGRNRAHDSLIQVLATSGALGDTVTSQSLPNGAATLRPPNMIAPFATARARAAHLMIDA